MPHVVFDIENSFATITRYVVKSVMEQLMFFTGITDAEIIYNEPLGYGKNSAANSDPNAPALKLDAKDYFIVTYNERFDEQVIDPFSTTIEHNPIFQHSQLGVYLRPITNKANIEFNLIYRSKSYNRLAVWLSRFQRNRIVRDASNYHDIRYNYTLPDVIIAYLYDIYHLSEGVEPYGLTLKEFNQLHYTKGLMSRSNISKTKNTLAINVESKHNLGRFTSLPEEISSDKDKLIHEVNFNYSLTYDKVVELLLEFQIFIHNQRIDSVYNDFFVRENYPKVTSDGERTFTGFVNTATERLDWYRVTIDDIFLDPIDHWIPTLSKSAYSTMLLAPIQIDTNNLTLVEDIDNFPVEKFPTIVKDFMKIFYQYTTTIYQFPYTLTLYAVDKEEKMSVINMDINGHITSENDLLLRKRYYLQLSLLLDLRRLPRWMLKLLCQYPQYLIDLLMRINGRFTADMLKLLNGGTLVDFESFWKLINSDLFTKNPLLGYGNASFNNQLFGYYNESHIQQSAVIVRKQQG